MDCKMFGKEIVGMAFSECLCLHVCRTCGRLKGGGGGSYN